MTTKSKKSPHPFFLISREIEIFLDKDLKLISSSGFYSPSLEIKYLPTYLIKADKGTKEVDENFYNSVFIEKIVEGDSVSSSLGILHVAAVEDFLDSQFKLVKSSKSRNDFVHYISDLIRIEEIKLYEQAYQSFRQFQDILESDEHAKWCFDIVWPWINKIKINSNFVGEPDSEITHKEQILALDYAEQLGIIKKQSESGVSKEVYDFLVERIVGKFPRNTREYIRNLDHKGASSPKTEFNLSRLQDAVSQLKKGLGIEKLENQISKDRQRLNPSVENVPDLIKPQGQNNNSEIFT